MNLEEHDQVHAVTVYEKTDDMDIVNGCKASYEAWAKETGAPGQFWLLENTMEGAGPVKMLSNWINTSDDLNVDVCLFGNKGRGNKPG